MICYKWKFKEIEIGLFSMIGHEYPKDSTYDLHWNVYDNLRFYAPLESLLR